MSNKTPRSKTKQLPGLYSPRSFQNPNPSFKADIQQLSEEIRLLTYANAELQADLEQEKWRSARLEKQVEGGNGKSPTPKTVTEFHPRLIIPSDLIPAEFWDVLGREQLAAWSEICLYLFRENETHSADLQLYDAVEELDIGMFELLRPLEESLGIWDVEAVWNNDVVWERILKQFPLLATDQLLVLASWTMTQLVNIQQELRELEAISNE